MTTQLEIPEAVLKLRDARWQFGLLRSNLLNQVHLDIELAEQTTRLLESIKEVLTAAERIPYTIRTNAREELVGELGMTAYRRREELQPLANRYGCKIVEHPTMRHYGIVVYAYPFDDSLDCAVGEA